MNGSGFFDDGDSRFDVEIDMTVPEGQAANSSSGLVAGTKVATAQGWRTVEEIRPLDRVLTFEGGLQEVTHVARCTLWQGDGACPRHLWPLAVPEGALGNAQPMVLLPEQPIIIESEAGAEIYGDSFTMIPAAAFEGFRGIERVEPAGSVEVILLYFAHDQVVFGSAGALFFCPSIRSVSMFDSPDETDGEYVVLGVEDAAFLLDCIEIDTARNAAEAEAEAEARDHAAFVA